MANRFFLLFLLFICSFAYAEESFVDVNGSKLYCYSVGKGEPLLILHGGPGLTHDYLLPGMEKLKDGRMLIFYDQRGCGKSDALLDDSHLIETYLEDIEAIRKAYGLKKMNVLGHSWGGLLAMFYVVHHPESVGKLVLLNTVAPSSEDYHRFEEEVGYRLSPLKGKLTSLAESKEFIERNPKAIKEYLQIIFETYCFESKKASLLNLDLSPIAASHFLQVNGSFKSKFYSKPFDLIEQLKSLNVPTLIIHGDSDPIPYHTVTKIQDAIAGSSFILMKDCGHFPYVEKPDELFNSLNAFLK